MSELEAPEVPQHRVRVAVGYTSQPESYHSLRVDLALEIDGIPGEKPSETFDRARAVVQRKFMEEYRELRDQL